MSVRRPATCMAHDPFGAEQVGCKLVGDVPESLPGSTSTGSRSCIFLSEANSEEKIRCVNAEQNDDEGGPDHSRLTLLVWDQMGSFAQILTAKPLRPRSS